MAIGGRAVVEQSIHDTKVVGSHPAVTSRGGDTVEYRNFFKELLPPTGNTKGEISLYH
jgi:hypothetical protein